MVSDEKDQTNQSLGLVYLMLGVSMTVSLGIALNPVFLATGIPFIVIGLYYLTRKDGKE